MNYYSVKLSLGCQIHSRSIVISSHHVLVWHT